MKVYPWHAVRYSDGTLPIFCLPGAANLKKADLNEVGRELKQTVACALPAQRRCMHSCAHNAF